jgi:hypothetical protein
MKFLLFFLIITFSYSSTWQVDKCPLSSNEYLEESYSGGENHSFDCDDDVEMGLYNALRSKKYSCSSLGTKVAQNYTDVRLCSTSQRTTELRINFIYYKIRKEVRQNCGSNAYADDYNTCVCNIPSMEYNSASNTCGCPAGTSYDGDSCIEQTCVPLGSPYEIANFNQVDCTKSNLQTLYNQNNTDGRIITDVKWHCDDKCYFSFSDNNTPDNNSTGTDSSNNSNYNSNNVDTSGIEQRLDTVNSNLNTLNNTLQNNTSSLGNKIDSVASNIDNLGIKIDNNGQIMNDNGQKIDALGNTLSNELKSQGNRLHDDLQDLKSSLSDNNSSNVFDDTRIVDSIHQNTQAINDIKDLHQGESQTDTSFFDTYQTYYNDMTQSIDNVENNVQDLMATIQGDYTPQFQTYNTCIINFPVYGKSLPVDMCRYSPILRPFITFILTISMLILLIRLHFYLFPKVMRSD